MEESAHVLFRLVDDTLNDAAGAITNQLLTELRDKDWELDQRDVFQSRIQQELDKVVWGIMGLFDNVGCVLPEDVDGWTLHSKNDGRDIRIGNADYADMWLDHLLAKGRLPR